MSNERPTTDPFRGIEAGALTLAEYQTRAAETAIYPGRGQGTLHYPILGMVEEACEVASLLTETTITPGMEDTKRDAVLKDFVVLAQLFGFVAGRLKRVHRDHGGVVEPDLRSAIDHSLVRIVEVAESLRDRVADLREFHLPTVQLDALATRRFTKEIGDVGWYTAAASGEAGLALDEVALANLENLRSRKERGTIHGSGDDR